MSPTTTLQEVEKAIQLALKKGGELLAKIAESVKSPEATSAGSAGTPSVEGEKPPESNA